MVAWIRINTKTGIHDTLLTQQTTERVCLTISIVQQTLSDMQLMLSQFQLTLYFVETLFSD